MSSMPRNRNIKPFLVKAIIIAVLASFTGHVGVNFWERHIFQIELLHMKKSLLFLKENIKDISSAYDALQTELKGISGLIRNKNPVTMNLMVTSSSCNEKWIAMNPDPDSRLQVIMNNFPPRYRKISKKNSTSQPQAIVMDKSTPPKTSEISARFHECNHSSCKKYEYCDENSCCKHYSDFLKL